MSALETVPAINFAEFLSSRYTRKAYGGRTNGARIILFGGKHTFI
jgi:hypothetical protein